MRTSALFAAIHIDWAYMKELGHMVFQMLLERWGLGFVALLGTALCSFLLIQKARAKTQSQMKLPFNFEGSTVYRHPAVISSGAVGLFLMALATVRAMMTTDGQIVGKPEIQAFAMILILPKTPENGLITADVVFADQGGRFMKRWMSPGDYQMLVTTHSETTLRYSIANFSKGLLPSSTVIPTNAWEMAFFGKTVDKFRLNRETLPVGGETLLELPSQPDFTEGFYVIIGHADVSGTERHNYALGLARAKEAAASLEAQGVPANHIIVASVGSAHPANKPLGNDNRALDRRIELLRIPDPYSVPAGLPDSAPQKGR